MVLQSDGLEQTRALAEEYVNRAIASIDAFPDCEAKYGLVEMAIKTLKRRKWWSDSFCARENLLLHRQRLCHLYNEAHGDMCIDEDVL